MFFKGIPLSFFTFWICSNTVFGVLLEKRKFISSSLRGLPSSVSACDCMALATPERDRRPSTACAKFILEVDVEGARIWGEVGGDGLGDKRRECLKLIRNKPDCLA